MVLKKTRANYNMAVVNGVFCRRMDLAGDFGRVLAAEHKELAARFTELTGEHSNAALLEEKNGRDKRFSALVAQTALQLEADPAVGKLLADFKELDAALKKARDNYNESAGLINAALQQPCGKLLAKKMKLSAFVLLD
jgi:hypothetical protein